MTDLIDTTEMYLRTVLELEEEGIVPMRARIAERLGHSGPTVSQTVARMERDGLLRVSGDRHLELSESGRLKAVRVMRKHRLAERLLMDVIGLEWQFVHEEACRWEHVMSDRVERKLLAMLADPEESPYGNPIPGLDELGGPATVAFREGVRPLTEVLADSDVARTGAAGGPLEPLEPVEVRVIVKRLGEPIQSDVELLARLVGAGVSPGQVITARRDGNGIEVGVGVNSITVSTPDAHHLFVAVGE